MKKAFTLAELMIVFTVIGVLTAILLPSAIHSTPNENILKFKKANNTLYQAIGELVANENYYKDGDLGKKPDGTDVDATYLCSTISDILSTKSVNCSEYKDSNEANVHYHLLWEADNPAAKSMLDGACKATASSVGPEIVATDGVVFYQTSPYHHFASSISAVSNVFYHQGCKGGAAQCSSLAISPNAYTVYKPFCIDVDGIGVGEDPFGYGIRVDGKIVTGARANEWIAKSIQNDD